MYIWILLATIMVALSFFNTSPREDKASVFTEIKASTFINRFRAEHTGYFRTLECDIIYNSNRYENSIIPIKKSDVENLGYTSLASNLPIGYNENDNGQVIYHGIYCFDKDLREEGAALTNCNTAAQRYLFSFSGISERWTSKAKYSITLPDTVTASSSGKVVEISAPVPAFSNYLAKELHGIKNTGWMYCADNKCYLVGRSSIQTLYDKNAAKNKYEKKEDGTYGIKNEGGANSVKDTNRHKYIALHLPAADSLGSDFMDTCSNNGMPCMFSAEKFKTTDIGGHCRGLMNSANNNNNTGTN